MSLRTGASSSTRRMIIGFFSIARNHCSQSMRIAYSLPKYLVPFSSVDVSLLKPRLRKRRLHFLHESATGNEKPTYCQSQSERALGLPGLLFAGRVHHANVRLSHAGIAITVERMPGCPECAFLRLK